MNKFLLPALLILLCSSVVSAADVAYVVKTSSNSNIVDVLGELEFSYDVIAQANIASTNFSDYAMILVQEDITNEVSLPLSSKNIVFINKDIAEYLWPSSQVWSSQTIFSNFQELGTPFTEGFSNANFQAYSSTKNIWFLKIKPSYVSRIALTTGSGVPAGIVAYSENEGRRRLFFGFYDASYWTANTKKLFGNSLTWARLGVDLDEDGYYGDDDCNDNDAEKWRLIQGYVDSDGDGFGSGELIDVCSGSSLEEGYSEIDGDCLNSNSNVNPDAEEIPYDYLDNDCSGGDLADLDEDGYCLSGYFIMSVFQCSLDAGGLGSDCDDSDSSINPSALEIVNDIDENCRNDAPILLEEIEDIESEEDSGYALDLDGYFADYEGEVLSYSGEVLEGELEIEIDSSLAAITPIENWNGEARIRFRVSDGAGSSYSNNVSVSVAQVNDAPVLEEINDISALEGDSVEIVINASDIDGDELDYFSDDRFTIDGNILTWQTEIGEAGEYEFDIVVSDGELEDSGLVRVTIIPKIVINEVLVDPSSGKEWVELYNPRDSEFNLTGCRLEDEVPHHIPLNGKIAAGGFFVRELTEYSSSVFNNDGDVVRLKCGVILIDEIEYGDGVETPSKGESIGRVEDGLDTDSDSDWMIYDYPTKGISNSEDMMPPTVTLIEPEDDSFFDSSEIIFNYTASDNSASELECSFYSDVLGEFEELAFETISNGSYGSFYASDVEDGEYSWRIACDDGNAVGESETRIFTVDEPDSPAMDVEDVTVYENETAVIVVNASDADGDALTYSVDDLRFTPVGNTFIWKTGFDDAGEYEFNVSVSDGLFTISEIVRVSVLERNRAPILVSEIPVLQFDEDSSLSVELGNYFIDEDGDELEYSVYDSSENIYFDDSRLYADENWNGEAWIIFRADDGADSSLSNNVTVTVNSVNDDIAIVGYFPLFNPLIAEDESLEFLVSVEDIDGDSEIGWYVDGVYSGEGDSFIYTARGDGTFEIKVIVNDSEYSDEHTWNLRATRHPQASSYNGETTNFSEMTEEELGNANFTLERVGFGKIEMFNVDLRDVVDFDYLAYISSGMVGLDSASLSSLAGKIARITLHNLGFEKTPTIYYDSRYTVNPGEITTPCPEDKCTDISYVNGTLTFYSSFSSFKIGDILTCSQKGGYLCRNNEICNSEGIEALESRCCSTRCVPQFSEIDLCKNVSDMIEISITEPDEGDDFKVGEGIRVKLKIKNNDEDSSFDVNAYLYDSTIDEEIESVSEELEIDSGKSEKLELELVVPSGIDEDDDFVIFVKVENGYCSQEYVYLDLERNSHDIEIKRFDVPDSVECGSSTEASVRVENVGKKDEDVTLSIESSELGISSSFSFELEKPGEDDSESKNFLLEIPDSVEEGIYSIRLGLEYAEEDREEVRELYVSCQPKVVESSVDSLARQSGVTKNVESLSLGERINSLNMAEMTAIVVLIFFGLGLIIVILYMLVGKR